jgi:hypothetical protein
MKYQENVIFWGAIKGRRDFTLKAEEIKKVSLAKKSKLDYISPK